MSVQLEIVDGNPWWLSPNIWTVPGSDPGGPPGMPVATQPAFVYARVRNNGSTNVIDASVRFYWANPAVGFDRTTANVIGMSYVSIAAGQMADVLCLTAWVPLFVNDGHECLLAEAFHPSFDPLPATSAFNVPDDRHVAQRNVSVVLAVKTQFHFGFEIQNVGRKGASFTLETQEGTLGELERLQPVLGSGFVMPTALRTPLSLGFVLDPKKAAPVITEIYLDANQRKGLTLIGKLDDGAAFIHVVQKLGDQIVGGLSVLVLDKA